MDSNEIRRCNLVLIKISIKAKNINKFCISYCTKAGKSY